MLALRFRGTLIPASATRFLARLLAPFFYGPVVVLGILGLVVADVWLLRQASLTGAVDSILVDPPMLLSVIGILLGATVVHELGDVAACRYGGATPGKIGVAVYIVYPASFTDVTQSYRLGRAGRVRTDLGGVYFNALTIAGLTAVYAHTQSPAVLLAIVFVHVEALQQLLPLGRLDGYFVVADLVGVPDLFGRIGPILPQCRSGASDPPEGRRAAPVGAGRRHRLGRGHRADHGRDPRVHAVERALDHGSGGRRDEPRMDATAGFDRRSRRGRYHPGRSVPRLVATASAGPRLAGRRHSAPHRRCRGPTAPASPNPPIDRGHPYRVQPEEIPMSGSDPTTHPTAMAASPMPYASAVASSAPATVSVPATGTAPVFTRTADELTERFLLRAQPRTLDKGLAAASSP